MMSDQSVDLATKHYLETALTKKLIPSSERDLNDTSEFRQLLGSVCFDICNALEGPERI
jgi:hypothetical protein